MAQNRSKVQFCMILSNRCQHDCLVHFVLPIECCKNVIEHFLILILHLYGAPKIYYRFASVRTKSWNSVSSKRMFIQSLAIVYEVQLMKPNYDFVGSCDFVENLLFGLLSQESQRTTFFSANLRVYLLPRNRSNNQKYCTFHQESKW